MAEHAERHHRQIRSFVRRAGRLTASQERALEELWPGYGVEYAPGALDFETLFGRSAPVVLEIGFGNGDALLDMARQNPARNYLGIEVHGPGVGHLLRRLDEHGCDNVRVLRHDAIEVLDAMLPDAALWFSYPLAILGAINILYGAYCAMAQSDMKKLVAYSSVSHMGYVLLGMSAFTQAGINGAVLQMFNHGTITAMMFLCVGVIYDRAHTREINGFGGLGLQMPLYMSVFSFALFAALGLPGLSGFVSEAMIFMGAFPTYRTVTMISALGIIIGAAYVLWMLQRVFLGPKNEKWDSLPDINAREMFTLVPIGLIVILMGVYPMPVLDLMKATLNNLIKVVAG